MNEINKAEVERVHADLLAQARNIVKDGEEHESIVIVCGEKNGKLIPEGVIAYPLTQDSRANLPPLMHAAAQLRSLAVHISEAWAVCVQGEGAKADNPLEGVRPSEHPDRVEVLMMIFVGDGWRAMARHEISTVRGVRTLADGEITYEGGGHSFGGNLMGNKTEVRQ